MTEKTNKEQGVMINNLKKSEKTEENYKKLKALFAEYVLPDPFTFDVVDTSEAEIIDDKEKILKKYPLAIERFADRDYIFKIATRDCHILAIASDEIKNDAQFFLKLCKKKIACAQYIGNRLRHNKQFLLALDDIDNRCWKYIQKIHCLGKCSLEQKIAMWCLFWLGGAVRKSDMSADGLRMQANIMDKNDKIKYTSWLGIFGVLSHITPKSPKEDIIKYISEYKCYTVDPYYSPIREADADIAKIMIAYDSRLILDLSNKNELLKDYGVVMDFWKANRICSADTAKSIRNFADDRQLAKLILEERECDWALEFFSENIRGDKEYILKLLFTPRNSGVCCKLLPADLAFVTDELKADKEFLERIGESNVRKMKLAEKRVKDHWYVPWRRDV